MTVLSPKLKLLRSNEYHERLEELFDRSTEATKQFFDVERPKRLYPLLPVTLPQPQFWSGLDLLSPWDLQASILTKCVVASQDLS